MRLIVLAPDQASGKAFYDAMGVEADYKTVAIAPRVQPNGTISLGEAGKRVEQDLIRELTLAKKEGYTEVAIACNTLQLFLKDIPAGLRVFTTFEALENKYPDAVWLGTTPLCKWIEEKQKYKTFLSIDPPTQKKVQDVIWLVKKYYGDDISNAPKDLNGDIGEIVEEIFKAGIGKGYKTYILGCTEWPLAVKFAKNLPKELTLIDPAVELGRMILQV